MPSLMLEIGASVAKLQSDMAKAQRTVDSFASTAKSAFGMIGGYLAGGAFIGALQDVSQAYIEQERALNKMATAMKNQGDYSKAALNDMEAYASQIQETSTVADEAAMSAMANLKSYGMLNDEVKRAIQVAVDFASAKKEEGMTVVAASEILGKAYIGQTERLKKYVGEIDETKSAAEKFNIVMERLRSMFGGAAQAELDTYEGKITQVKNAFGDMKEDLGKLALAFGTAFLPQIKGVIEELKKATEGMLMFFDTTKRGIEEHKRMAIIDEMNELERLMKDGPSWWDRLKSSIFGESGDMPENTVAAQVYGKKEEWAARYAELQAELQKVGQTIHTFDVEEKKVAPGGKRTIYDDKDKEKDAQKERDKWLNEYLKGVDQAMKAEQERSELVGQLYMMDWQWTIERNDKQLKAEEEYMKSLEDIRMAQLEAEADARDQQLKDEQRAAKEMESIWTHTAELMQDNFSSLFIDVMQGKLTSFADFASRIFQSIQKAASDYLGQIATDFIFGDSRKSGGSGSGLFGSLLKFGGSLIGSAVGGAGVSTFSGAEMNSMMWLHKGGVVGETPAPMRFVPAAAFAGAPRLHGGLSSDEYPAILQRGETVIPKGDIGKQEQQPPMSIVINAVDAASFAQLAARNPSAITGPVMEALQKGGQLRNLIRGVV